MSVYHKIREKGPNPLTALQHAWVDFSIELQDPAGSGSDSLVPALSVLDQVSEEIFLHGPRLPSTHFSDGVDSCSNDFTPNARMDKLLREFLDNGGEGIRRGEVVYTLCKRDEDSGDAELMVCEILENVGVEREDGEFVGTHDAGEELHEEDFVVEGETLVISAEVVVELLGKGLWVVEELQGRKIRGGGIGNLVLFLWTMHVVSGRRGTTVERTFLAALSCFWSFLSALRVFLLISRR